MNSTTNVTLGAKDSFTDAFIKNFIVVLLGVVINCINGMFVYVFFKSSVFFNEPRYILYIHLVINDMLMLSLTVLLYILSYTSAYINMSLCCVMLIMSTILFMNTPFSLAGMAVERYIAICIPLRHSQICTVRGTYILLCLIWGMGVIPSVADIVILLVTRPLAFFTSSLMCYSVMVFNTSYHINKRIVMNMLYPGFVWLTLIYTYLRVIVAARAATTDRVSAKKAQNTILLHGAQLLLSMLSYFNSIIDTFVSQYFPNDRTKVLFSTFLFMQILPRFLTPFIYGIRDKKLVQYLKKYILCKRTSMKIKPDIT